MLKGMNSARLTAHGGTGIFLLAGWLLASPLLAGTEHYDDLIARAREGETGPALAMLRKAEPVTLQIRHDHLLVASWADLAEEVVQIYQSLPRAQAALSADVQLAAARAWRDLQQWQEALSILTTGLYRHPGREPDFAAGYIMTLADAGQLEDAISHAGYWAGHFADNADVQMAKAYVHTRLGQVYDALYHIDKALQLAPHAFWVQHEYVLTLQRAGLTGPALEWVAQRPDLLTPAQLRALQGDDLARQTRLAEAPARNEIERFTLADRALARYDELIANWQALGAEAAADVIRLRIDRLSALHARVRMEYLIREYRQLHAEGIKFPAWTLGKVASAYLYLREPEQARAFYQTVLDAFNTMEAADPPEPVDADTRLDNEIGLVYALLESGQFEQVPALLERLKERHGPWLWLDGQPERLPNERWLEVRQTLATASLLGNDTASAQQQLEAMTAAAPNNSNLHADLAAAYRARGWPRRAEVQLKLAETLEPRALAVETGQGYTALDLQEWRQAEALSADTVARYPEQPSSRRLARLWRVHNKAEIRVNVNRRLSSDSPVVGSGGIAIGTVLYSAPIRYNWRVFSGLAHASGSWQEGPGHHNQQSAGVEWRSRNLWLEGEISHHRYGDGSKPGARVAGAYDFGDHLRIGASLEWFSAQTPLRALGSNISANTLEAYLHWRASDHREWRFTFAPMHFSDGNQRRAFTLDASQRLHTAPQHWLDLLFEASTQRNSRGGEGPYFNPRRDLNVLPGLRLTQLLHRRYDTMWQHTASVSAGRYQQHGETSGNVIALSYGQRYRSNDVLDIGGFLNAISRPYDGRRERELRVLFDLNYRF